MIKFIALLLAIFTLQAESTVKVKRQPNLMSTTWLPKRGENFYWTCVWQEEVRPWPIVKIVLKSDLKTVDHFEAYMMWAASQKSANGLIKRVMPGFTYEVDGWRWIVSPTGFWHFSQIKDSNEQQLKEEE